MVIRYLDPEFGNDANDGLSFANRKKTLASASATLTGGDEIRIIESVESLFSTTLPWIDNTTTITIPGGTVKTINDFNSAWTHSANVSGTTSTSRKIGATSPAINIAAGFTTGKASYFTLPSTVNLSSWQCVSFWFLMSNTNASQNMDIVLCSDTTGDTPVVTIPLVEDSWTANRWKKIFYDHGSSLPGSINSVALYVNADLGACNCLINNMVASFARSSTDHISHISLIGQKTTENPEYYSIHSITESTVTILDHADRTAGDTGIRAYRGPSGSFNTYIMKAVPTKWNNTSGTSTSGTNAKNRLNITGGWDAATMTTQSGVTWLNFLSVYDFPILGNFLNIEKLGLADISDGTSLVINSSIYNLEGVINWTGGGNPYNHTSTLSSSYTCKFLNGGVTSLTFSASNVGGMAKIDIGLITRVGANTLLNSFYSDYNINYDIKIDRYWNNAFPLLSNQSHTASIFKGINFKNNTTDISTTNAAGGSMVFQNCVFDTTPVLSLHASSPKSTIILSGVNNNIQDVRIHTPNYTIITDTVVTNSTGRSWKVSPTVDNGLFSNECPIMQKLGTVAVKSGTLVTVTCYVYRSHATQIVGGIMVEEGWISGVADQKVPITVGATTWEQLTLTFTPTVSGVIPIYGYCYPDGGTTHSFYFDDLNVTQV